jgi:hypothetical protein
VQHPPHGGKRRRMAGKLRCWATHRWMPKNRVATLGKGPGLASPTPRCLAFRHGGGGLLQLLLGAKRDEQVMIFQPQLGARVDVKRAVLPAQRQQV